MSSGRRNCNFCGTDGARKVCGACRNARYCGQTCQRSAWQAHKQVCRERSRNSHEVDEQRLGGSSSSPRAFSPNSDASFSSNAENSSSVSSRSSPSSLGMNWWSGLSIQRQRERFMMSFQLRNDDVDHCRSRQARPSVLDDNMEERRREIRIISDDTADEDLHHKFLEYARLAHRKGLLPEVCHETFLRSSYARQNVRHALDRYDVVARFGRSSGEYEILKAMMRCITGTGGFY